MLKKKTKKKTSVARKKKKIDEMEASVPDLRPLRMSTGNKNWYGKVLFFFFLAIYDLKLD